MVTLKRYQGAYCCTSSPNPKNPYTWIIWANCHATWSTLTGVKRWFTFPQQGWKPCSSSFTQGPVYRPQETLPGRVRNVIPQWLERAILPLEDGNHCPNLSFKWYYPSQPPTQPNHHHHPLPTRQISTHCCGHSSTGTPLIELPWYPRSVSCLLNMHLQEQRCPSSILCARPTVHGRSCCLPALKRLPAVIFQSMAILMPQLSLCLNNSHFGETPSGICQQLHRTLAGTPCPPPPSAEDGNVWLKKWEVINISYICLGLASGSFGQKYEWNLKNRNLEWLFKNFFLSLLQN